VPDPSPEAAESIQRPDPGLGRGRWEAPPWAFYATMLAVILGGFALLAVALRMRRSPR
jgi:hypothetical protein